MLTPSWLDGLELGDAVSCEALDGGVANQTYRVRTSLGHSVVVKTHEHAPLDLYAHEADGLNALRVPGGFVVPEVLRVTEEFLVLADLGSNRAPADWREAGHRLAVQHQQTADKFGYHHDNYLGMVPQRNPWTVDGHAFFAEHRLLRFLEVPLCYNALTATDRRNLERVANRLSEFIPEQSPALLHGDLWHGNLMADLEGAPAVIDPAVYYGWPEAELSMLTGCGNIPDEFFTAYVELHPLEPGWRDRMPLLHLREHLAVTAHFADAQNAVNEIRTTLAHYS